MTLTLSAAAIVEKNTLASSGTWIVLLAVTLSDGTVVRICRNNKDVIWNSHTWTAFPFELDDLSEEAGEPSLLQVRVSNVTRALMVYLEGESGLVGDSASLYVVHSDHLTQTTAEIEESFKITKTSTDSQWISFKLSAPSMLKVAFPTFRYIRNWCRWKFNYPTATDVRCGYSGATPFTACNKTLAECRERGNSTRFGGFPGIPEGGLYTETG